MRECRYGQLNSSGLLLATRGRETQQALVDVERHRSQFSTEDNAQGRAWALHGGQIGLALKLSCVSSSSPTGTYEEPRE